MTNRGLLMIIDDDSAEIDGLRRLLEDDGYRVGKLASAGNLVAEVAGREPDLILLGTILENGDPAALLKRLREDPATRDTPVILITGLENDGATIEGLESADDLLIPPFDRREVLARFERQVTVSKVRRALRESEAKFRSVMESAIDAIISGDAEGRIRSWNRAAMSLFGFTESEVLGKPIEVIIPERYREAHRRGIERVSSGGQSRVIGKTVELAATHQDGREFPVELSLATWELDGQRYYTGIIRDITERKQAELKFRSVTDSAIDAIISADHTGIIVSWNKAATRILGYTEEEAVGQRLEFIIPKRFHEAHQNGMARVTETGQGRVIGRTVELSACRKGGAEVPIELSLSTWTVRNARYYTGIIRDIGERKRAEDALRTSEQALRRSTEQLEIKNEELQETLARLEETQNQLVLQEKMASLGRLSAGMAHELNNPASAVNRGAAHLSELFQQLMGLDLAIAGASLSEQQLKHLRELDSSAEERAGAWTPTDPLDRSDLESEIEDWLTKQGISAQTALAPSLVELGYTISDLVSLAEQFRGPLLAVVLSRLAFWHDLRGIAREVRVGSDHIVEIVNALKNYSHLDRGPTRPVNVHEGLESTLVVLRNKLKEGVRVTRQYADDIPMIAGHAGELNQVWTNIIDNAIDAMGGHGQLTIRTSQEGAHVVVEVTDDGPGIPPEAESRIFDPFFTTKAPGEGTGLGLAISHNIVVKKHSGQMVVNSKPGRTQFTVLLPVSPV